MLPINLELLILTCFLLYFSFVALSIITLVTTIMRFDLYPYNIIYVFFIFYDFYLP